MTRKSFFICFSEATSDQPHSEGKISLDGKVETFTASTQLFSKAEYENHWKNSVRKAVQDRQVSALFSDVNLENDGTGWLFFYTLIPSEETTEGTHSNTGVFVTQRFVPVCTKPESFLTRKFIEYDDGSKGEELSFYFLDLDHPERFFGYLDTNILGVSNWFVKNRDMESFLSQ